ncbi:MAG: hypothetical protein JNL74_20455, partial [Fibrobacteres bacterium]|nr:hypothetical protein [Fibrobacterota bacterium]
MLNFTRSKQIFLLVFFAMVGSSQAFSVVHIIFNDWVMWPIMALSVIAFAVILERLMVVFLEKRKIKPSKFMDEFLAKVGEDGKGKDAAVAWGVELCEKKGGILSALLLAAFHKYKDGKEKNMHAGELKEWMTKSVEQRAGVELM